MPHLKCQSGIEWFYEVEGEGKVLVFLHGWGVDRRIFNQQIKHCREKYKVISLDLPGHGQSSWEKLGFEVMVKDIKEILDVEHVKSCVILGSSLGGLFGLKFYDLFPGYVEKLIFIGSMPKFAKDKDYPYGLDVARIRKLSHQLDDAFPSIIHIFFRSLFTMHERESRRFKWLMKFRKMEVPPKQTALHEYLDLLEKEDLRYVLKTISIPVAYFNGREDYICPQESVELLAQMTPQVTVHFFDNCGHFPFLTEPYAFNEVLSKFLE